MRKLLGLIFLFAFPVVVFAAPTSWDLTAGVLQPLQNAWTATVKADHFVATSTSAINSFPNILATNATTTSATTTNQYILGVKRPAGYFLATDANGQVIGTTTPSSGTGTVTQINTTFPLSGGPITTTGTLTFIGLSTTSPFTNGQITYVSNGNLTSRATTTASCSGTVSCTSFDILGSSPITITGSSSGGSSIGTTSDIAVPGVAYFTSITPSILGSVATGTVSSANTALSVTANRYVLGGALTLTVATTSTNMFTGLPGQVLAFLNGGWTGAATTTFSSPLNYSAGNVSVNTTGSGTTLVLSSAPTLTNPIVGTQSPLDNSTKAASTAYVDAAVVASNPAIAVQAATTQASDTSGLTYNNGVGGIGATFTGSVNTAVVIDGYTFNALNQRLLVKNDTQSPSGAFNGIYYLTTVQGVATAPVFTRALDYNQPSDINNTGSIPVVNGTVNATTSWLLTSTVATVGTDPLTYTQFSRSPTSILPESLGGTNQSTYTTGDILYASNTNTLSKLGITTKGFVLANVNGIPGWVATSSINNGVSSLIVPQGTFTGAITLATSSNTTNGLTSSLTIVGSGSTLTFTPSVSGTHTVPGGGTGAATFTSGQVLYGAGTAALQSVATSSIANGTGITVTNGSSAYVLGSQPTINLANTAVTPASYTCTNLTVDQQGRLTAASNGTCGVSDPFTHPSWSGTITSATSTPIWFQATSPFSLMATSSLVNYASSTALTTTGNTYLSNSASGQTIIGNSTAPQSGYPLTVFESTSGSPIAAFQKAQGASDVGGYIGLYGGTNGTTLRGLFCVTQTGSGGATCLTGEQNDSIAIRSESWLHFGSGGANLAASIDPQRRFGIGTSTPYAALSVSTSSANFAGQTLFSVANSANSTLFNVLGNGFTGIGTSTPGQFLSIANTSSGFLASTTATSTFQGGGINLTTAAGNRGCFAIDGVCLTSSSGTVTSVATNYSLTGGPITTSGTLAVATSSLYTGALGGLPYFSGTNTLSAIAAGTGGQILAMVSGIPGWVGTTTAGTGLTYNGGSPGNFSVNTSQNIATLSNLTTNGYVKTSGGVGTLTVQAVPIPVADGGTASTSAISNGIFYYDSGNTRHTNSSGLVFSYPNLGLSSSTPSQLFSVGTTGAEFYINSSGEVVGRDQTNAWTGRISPTHSFVLSTGTTTTWTASTTASAYSPSLVMPFAGTLQQVRCQTSVNGTGGSFLGVNTVVNGSNATPSYFVASSTIGLIKFTAGNTFSAGQIVLANFGTTTTATATNISCTFDVTETP